MSTMAIKKSVAVLIPAYNEEDVLADTIRAILKLVPAEQLYIVNDGSTDATYKIARKYTGNVLTTQNQGKAHALNTGLKYFRLSKLYKYIFFMDADTQPAIDFLDKTLKHFISNEKGKVVCVVGRVKGRGDSWVSKYRQWEYQISHYVHKKAQEKINSIIVVPGCATIYNSLVFEKLNYPQGTMTEDMDFTFLLHRNNLNRMVFEDSAVVYTQDPENVKDFIKQVTRWYTGFWQVVKKHNIPWHGQLLDFEVSMLALEGLYNGMIVLTFLISFLPLAVNDGVNIFLLPFLIDLLLFFIPTLLWSSLVDKDLGRIMFIPHFYFLRILSSLIFLRSFFRGYLSLPKQYVWNSNRYLPKKGL